MSVKTKTLIVAAGLVVGATTAAFAQEGWIGVAGPGAPAFGPGCYACPPGTGGGAIYDRAGPGPLLDYAGPARGVAYTYAPGPYSWGDPFHTGSNYLWFRPDGPGRGDDAESER